MTDLLNNVNIFSRGLANAELLRPRRSRKIYKKRYDPFTALSEVEFKMKYRFTKQNMRLLIDLVRPDLETNNKRGGKISTDLQVLCAIRYWGRNEIQDDCADIHGFSQQTMSVVCKRVATAFGRLAPQYIKMPHTIREQEATAAEFYRIKRFPGVLGAIDCTHIKIRKVGGDAGQYYINRKGYYSLNVQVVCNANLKIMDIVAHWRGSTHDARIFRESSIKQRFEDGHFNGRLLGDGGYACTPYLFTPVRNPTTPEEVAYNRAQMSTRNTVERCFGVWKQRFRCLLRGMAGSLSTIKTTVVALAVLQCLAIDMNDPHLDEDDERDGGAGGSADMELQVAGAGNTNQTGNAHRQVFIREHF